MSMHGHIHESPLQSGKVADCIGGVHSINPGHGDMLLSRTFDTNDLNNRCEDEQRID